MPCDPGPEDPPPSPTLIVLIHSLKQYSGYQTDMHSPVRPPKEILKNALQELGTVYHTLQEAHQHNICSKDILQAAMSVLSSVSQLLQQSSVHSQPEPSPHMQCQKKELLHYVMSEHQDSRSPGGGGISRHHTFHCNSSSRGRVLPPLPVSLFNLIAAAKVIGNPHRVQYWWPLINMSLFSEPHLSNKCTQV